LHKLSGRLRPKKKGNAGHEKTREKTNLGGHSKTPAESIERSSRNQGRGGEGAQKLALPINLCLWRRDPSSRIEKGLFHDVVAGGTEGGKGEGKSARKKIKMGHPSREKERRPFEEGGGDSSSPR